MSFVEDRVRLLDSQIDRICLSPLLTQDGFLDGENGADDESYEKTFNVEGFSSAEITEKLWIVKALSSSSSSQALLGSERIQSLLVQSGLVDSYGQPDALDAKSAQQTEIEWLLISKATLQVYGLLFNTLLDQIIPLSNDIWYWDSVLSSYTYSSLFTVQTAPLRFWVWAKEIAVDTQVRLRRLQASPLGVLATEGPQASLSQRWARFYGIVRESIVTRSLANVQRRVMSPIALCRTHAKQRQAQLKKLRDMTASGLGVLIDEALSFGADEDLKTASNDANIEWKGFVERSVALMDLIVREVLTLETGVSDFEHRVFRGVEDDPELSIHAEDVAGAQKPAILAQRLMSILQSSLPNHVAATNELVKEHGRPPRLVRYWLPATVLLLSSSTILKVLVNRQEDVLQWIADLGATMRDFWFNWVIEPTRKVVGTIRHDSNSEIAIMSRDSLRADRDSLERMVVEFALERPELAGATSALNESQVSDLRAKIREGDVTPVLKAYESELKRPFVGAIRGDLLRSLLIQVQKTKVDLETAIRGIDALLKSQELVFGFVGLTPGILVTYFGFQYLRTLLSGRKGTRRGERAVRAVRVLRNIDRIFSDAMSSPSQDNLLPYKDYGLLVCEVHVLRKLVNGVLPADVEREFLEDLEDVVNVKGITAQMRAFDRIRWAYRRWL
ncbi:hypothetical protein M0657_006556 [Pyricularia oryzae]|nr:hypothetical protein M0657_006556 [Pyricularia oryzae]